MDQNNNLLDLLVLGVHLKSEGYPNTLFRLRDLERSGLFDIDEINIPMWSERTQNRHGISRLTRNFFRALFSHIIVIIRYLIRSGWKKRVYIPYPAVFVLFLLSCLPAKLRPRRIVADVFISLYDTIVLDRQLIKPEGLLARFIKWIERRAYIAADKLVVDTPQNAKFLSSLFQLSDKKIEVIPLSTDEVNFNYMPYTPQADICRVLFVGTLAPLHGINILLEAANLLSEHSSIQFRLIGEGQESSLVERWLITKRTNLKWEKGWQRSHMIAEEINRADICLGIFGAGEKTQRVCPFKIYAYASVGRAIITGDSDWLKDTSCNLEYKPFVSVPVNNAVALAEKITQLANAPLSRKELAENSHRFYHTHLANHYALAKLVACLTGI